MDPGVPGVLMRMAALAPPYMAPQNTPPSPMSAMSGGMEKVKGTNRATAVTVVMPGSIPPTMPTTSPMNITSRFMGTTAPPRPDNIPRYGGMDCTGRLSVEDRCGSGSTCKVVPSAANLPMVSSGQNLIWRNPFVLFKHLAQFFAGLPCNHVPYAHNAPITSGALKGWP